MSCPKGKIRRVSYSRKGYTRKAYTNKKGSRVHSARISRTRVPSACVKDTGKPGKTPSYKKVLPKPSKNMSLSKYGYSTHKSASIRRQALKKASGNKPLPVLRRLNLLANYQADPTAKAAMREDVEFMSNFYKQYKRQQSRTTSKKTSNRKGSKKGAKKGSRKH